MLSGDSIEINSRSYLSGMKYFLRCLAISFILSAIVIICAFIYTVRNLPNPFEFKKTVQSFDQNAKLLNQQAIMENAFVKAAIENAESGQTVIGAEPVKNADKIDIDKDIFKQLLDEEFSDIRVCENLGSGSEKIDSNTMGLALLDLRRIDPTIESFRIPMKYVFQSEPVRELLQEVQGLEEMSEPDKTKFLEKTNFYYKASLKLYDFYRHKKEYEAMADRAFHLYVINQMTLKNPDLKNNNHVMDFCKSLESSIGSKNNVDIDTERAAVLKLIEYYGFKPEDLGFNPKVKTKFNVELKNRSLSFGFEHPGINL